MKLKHLLISMAAVLMSFGASAGEIVTDSLRSEVLGAVRHYNVYLPDGYDRDASVRYPALYLLHGFSDDHTAWEVKGQLQTVLDELIATGEARPMIVIMPEAGGPDTHNVWNGYFDMKGWPYEKFFFEEFLPKMENKYRIIADKGHRAISGLSMGGGGSVSYSQKHPEMFSSCYDFSGWLESQVNGEMRKAAAEGEKVALVSCSVADNSCPEFLRKADDATKEKLRTVKWFIDCGDDDFLLDVNTEFHRLMRESGIHSEMRVRNGQHNWEYWHTGLRMSLPFASRNFDK